jgi:hypothetical protein
MRDSPKIMALAQQSPATCSGSPNVDRQLLVVHRSHDIVLPRTKNGFGVKEAGQ